MPVLKKVALTVTSTVFALLLCEVAARFLLDRGEGPFAHNPIIRQQAQQVNLFERDPVLGHRLRGGGFVGVYQAGLVSFDEIVSDKRRVGKIFVLNIGDSSTSGWDSNVVVGNSLRQRRGEPLKSPFQAYRTYSDLLAADARLYVVNAGVPGFSSLQGAQYLQRLLDAFARANVHVDVVTLYFGNNDSAWNGNIADRYLLPGNEPSLHLARLVDAATARWRLIPRVDVREYGERMHQMTVLARRSGAMPLIIEPVVPQMWPPGLRAMGLEHDVEIQLDRLRGLEVGILLGRARLSFDRGMSAFRGGRLREAADLLNDARETDYLVPRIKARYTAALATVARTDRVPLVSIAAQLPLDDTKYFIDYCHPIEPANRLIATAISDAINRGRPIRSVSTPANQTLSTLPLPFSRPG